MKSGAGSSRGLNRKKHQLLITELGEKRADLKQIDDEILELLHDSAEDEAVDKEMEEVGEYREKMTYTIISIQDALDQMNINPSNRGTSSRTRGSWC